MGNVRSVHNALDVLGLDAVVTADAAVIARAERLILPGVGAFGDAMGSLKARGLVEVLSHQVLQEKKPFLGVCLGMQLLARSSAEHGAHEGLGWFDADVLRFDLPNDGLKVPHMGWNDVTPRKTHPLLRGLREDQFVFYFVHSFHVVCHDATDVVAVCEYGYDFAAAIARDNIFATQFHPEKSQDNGLQILRNFAEWAP
jgi:glutamine amidotransferase